jgi:hypothetical protein
MAAARLAPGPTTRFRGGRGRALTVSPSCTASRRTTPLVGASITCSIFTRSSRGGAPEDAVARRHRDAHDRAPHGRATASTPAGTASPRRRGSGCAPGPREARPLGVDEQRPGVRGVHPRPARAAWPKADARRVRRRRRQHPEGPSTKRGDGVLGEGRGRAGAQEGEVVGAPSMRTGEGAARGEGPGGPAPTTTFASSVEGRFGAKPACQQASTRTPGPVGTSNTVHAARRAERSVPHALGGDAHLESGAARGFGAPGAGHHEERWPQLELGATGRPRQRSVTVARPGRIARGRRRCRVGGVHRTRRSQARVAQLGRHAGRQPRAPRASAPRPGRRDLDQLRSGAGGGRFSPRRARRAVADDLHSTEVRGQSSYVERVLPAVRARRRSAKA